MTKYFFCGGGRVILSKKKHVLTKSLINIVN